MTSRLCIGFRTLVLAALRLRLLVREAPEPSSRSHSYLLEPDVPTVHEYAADLAPVLVGLEAV